MKLNYKKIRLTRVIFSLLFVVTSYTSLAQQTDTSILSQLSPEEILMLRAAYDESSSKDIELADIPPIRESLVPKTTVEDGGKSDSKKFGYNFISSMPTSTSAVGDLPLPNEYRISLRDQLTIILSGSKEAIFDLNVDLDGSILFPELGSISVVGKTFSEVKQLLSALVNQSYIGVQIDVSIKNLSAKKITIVGAVETPGTYLVNPFSTISSALAYSGGISEIGTLRNIRLIRNNEKEFNFDLYALLIDGDRKNDITIEAGDVIIIDPADQFVLLEGEVKRPAIYEVKANETLEDLVRFGLGFSQLANKSNISLRILDIESSSIQNMTVSNLNSDLDNVQGVNVNRYINKNISSIRVSGAIAEPGYYALDENETLESVINNISFVDVYPWLAILEQFDDQNLLKTTTLFNLFDKETYSSIKLLPNSRIFFADINRRSFEGIDSMTRGLISDYGLRINHKQGTFNLPVYGKFSVKSFINLLGLDMSDVDNEATYISPLENIVIKDDYSNMQFIAKKYNTISFRSPVNDLISVRVIGAVDYPGTYTLQPNSTLEDLYKLVGNFKNEAFLDGIIFTRESIRRRQLDSINKSKEDLNKALLTSTQKGQNIGDISIIRALSETIEPENLGRIAGNFSPSSSNASRTILFDGDTLIIPKNPSVINVIGEVLNPIAFEYTKDMNIRSAVTLAGGFQDYADKRKVYVIKANGIIKRNNRNIFAGGSVNLQPGDTIVVPRKIITNNPGIDALIPLTAILADLSFSAAALDNLRSD